LHDNHALRKLLPVLALAAFLTALLVWLTGAIDTRVAGVPLRARGVLRPLTVACALTFVYAFLERRRLASALRDPERAPRAIAP